jgi:hypothetical protein
VVTTVIVVFGAGEFLYSRSSDGKNTQSFTFPNSWVGKWSGTITQPDSSVHSWTFTMSLKETHGEIVGSYVESSLEFSGSLSTTFADSSKLELDEAVTAQPPSGTPWFCGGGPIQIKRTGTDSATYSWDGGVAHGMIRRQKGVRALNYSRAV